MWGQGSEIDMNKKYIKKDKKKEVVGKTPVRKWGRKPEERKRLRQSVG